MTPREKYFSITEGKRPPYMPFIPDITDWFNGRHTPEGEALAHFPAVYVPDDDPVKDYDGTMPEKYCKWPLMKFYRHFGWGFHAHIYDWFDKVYDKGVTHEFVYHPNEYHEIFKTPKGTLDRTYKLAIDGSWCPMDFLLKSPDDFEILFYILNAETYGHKHDYVNWTIDGVGDQGEADLTVNRSPFGKLVQEYLGFENTAYALYDCPELIDEYLAIQTEKDMQVINMACESRARLVMISDHADQNLISKNWYEQYCIPFYRNAAEKLHAHNKIISTHLDGNFKDFFPLLGKTGFDVLDGCTPAPMFNYEIEELAEAMPDGMTAFIGVPSSLFCMEDISMDVILGYAERIMKAFRGRGIINVGDILPPNGDIEKVIKLGEYVKAYFD